VKVVTLRLSSSELYPAGLNSPRTSGSPNTFDKWMNEWRVCAPESYFMHIYIYIYTHTYM
jgi:hypothetical protein